jgi:hypothetical protein
MSYRGWEVIYKDGTSVKETDIEWKAVKKNQINQLKLWFDGRCWSVSNKDAYIQKKRGSMVPGFSESFRVESRSIGYQEGSDKVWYTVDEDTGIMKMNVEEL